MSDSLSDAVVNISKDRKSSQKTNTPQQKNKLNKTLMKTQNIGDIPLDVGIAKYPQSLWISLYGFMLTTIVIVIVVGVFYYETKDFFREMQQQELEINASYIDPIVRDIYEHLEGDLLFLSRTPPVQGIIKSLKHNDKVNDKLWRKRLNIILTEMMRSYSEYQEISYIETGKSPKILVKVTRKNDELVISSKEELKSVIKPGGRYNDAFKKNMVHFQYTHHPMEQNGLTKEANNKLSLTVPIYDADNNNLFGVIIVKSYFFSKIKLDLLTLLGNDIFFIDDEGKIFFNFTNDATSDANSVNYYGLLIQDLFPTLSEVIEEEVNFHQVNLVDKFNEESAGLYHSLYMHHHGSKNLLRFFIKSSADKLNEQLTIIQYKAFLLALSLLLVSVVIAFLIGRRLSKPLAHITQELVRYGNTGTVGELPITSKNETGVLARSFYNMLVQKEKNDLDLMQQKNALDEHAIVSISDVSGTILYVNDKFTHVTGYSREELVGENHRIINSGHHPKEFFSALFEKITQGKVWQGEVCNRTKQGNLYWERATVVPFLNSRGKLEKYVSIRTEITENKKNAQAVIISRDILSQKVSELEEVNAELNQFAYIASHDLKSPLNGISQIVTWLEEDCQDILPKESKEHLFLLRNRTTRMIGLLNDLLEYSKVGRLNYPVETIYLGTVVDDIFSMLGDNEGFTCTAPNAPLIVPKTPFEVIIRNLITNAIKHHHKKEGNIKITMEQDSNFYFIKVTDDGPGIPPALHEKAVEMFQTLKSRDAVDGSGMGLAIVKKSIEHYGGTLSIESDGENGTSVVIKWPQKPLCYINIDPEKI